MWEFKSKTLVTLCRSQEEGEESCFPCWPSKENEKVKYGKVYVTLQSTTSYDQFTQRKYIIHDEKVICNAAIVDSLMRHVGLIVMSSTMSCCMWRELLAPERLVGSGAKVLLSLFPNGGIPPVCCQVQY